MCLLAGVVNMWRVPVFTVYFLNTLQAQAADVKAYRHSWKSRWTLSNDQLDHCITGGGGGGGANASQITSLTVVYSTVYSGADQRKHQSSASLSFVGGIHRRPVNSPHKWPVTWKMFSFDDGIMDLTRPAQMGVTECCTQNIEGKISWHLFSPTTG